MSLYISLNISFLMSVSVGIYIYIYIVKNDYNHNLGKEDNYSEVVDCGIIVLCNIHNNIRPCLYIFT